MESCYCKLLHLISTHTDRGLLTNWCQLEWWTHAISHWSPLLFLNNHKPSTLKAILGFCLHWLPSFFLGFTELSTWFILKTSKSSVFQHFCCSHFNENDANNWVTAPVKSFILSYNPSGPRALNSLRSYSILYASPPPLLVS